MNVNNIFNSLNEFNKTGFGWNANDLENRQKEIFNFINQQIERYKSEFIRYEENNFLQGFFDILEKNTDFLKLSRYDDRLKYYHKPIFHKVEEEKIYDILMKNPNSIKNIMLFLNNRYSQDNKINGGLVINFLKEEKDFILKIETQFTKIINEQKLDKYYLYLLQKGIEELKKIAKRLD